MDREALENLAREELVIEARRIGVQRPEVMTRVELVDEVLRLGTPNPVERKQVRGWLGVARDLLASAIELGLNLPDAAALIRGDVRFEPLRPEQRPVATVTLAEIYGAQGHFDRALSMLDEVLAGEPDHDAAQRLRARLVTDRETRVARQQRAAAESAPPAYASAPPDERRLEEDEPDHVTWLPERPELHAVEEAPHHETLVPASPQASVLGDEGTDNVTLMPTRPERHSLDDEELDHVTLSPPRADFAFASDEPDGVTLVPARPDPSMFDDDDSPTLVPESPGTFADGSEPEPPTLPPSLQMDGRDTDPRATTPSLPVPPMAAERSGAFEGASSSDIAEPVEAARDEAGPPADVAGQPEAASDEAVPPTSAAHPVSATAAASPAEPSAASSDSQHEPGIVLSRVGATSALLYYELGDVHVEGGAAVVRVVEHRPKFGDVERVERDLRVTGPTGLVTVLDLEQGSFVRAALGRKYDGRFEAVAVAAEVTLGSGSIDVGWAPRTAVDYAALAGRSRMAENVASD